MKKIIALCLCGLILCGCSAPTVKEGDIVKADFVGIMDNKEFEGGSAKDQVIEIGAGQYIAGFEDGMVGMKKGETKDVKLNFPDNYYEELAGKEVTFKITVQKIYKEVK